MPILRSSRQNSLQSSSEKSLPNIQQAKGHFTVEDFKNEYENLMSQISGSEIRNCLKTSSSDADFYSEICREELKKLEEEKYCLEKRIQMETEMNKRKDAEAARIVKKLWEETNKTTSKYKKTGNKNSLKPEDVKKVWAEAKRLSNQSKEKKKKLVAQKNILVSKIQLAKEAIRFCHKFDENRRK